MLLKLKPPAVGCVPRVHMNGGVTDPRVVYSFAAILANCSGLKSLHLKILLEKTIYKFILIKTMLTCIQTDKHSLKIQHKIYRNTYESFLKPDFNIES